MKNGLTEDQIFQDFESIGGEEAEIETLVKFLERNSDPPGSEYENYISDDFMDFSQLKLGPKISDPKFLEYAENIHHMWPILTKKLKTEDFDENLGTLLKVNHPVVLAGVPRFRETYYWDTFWIFKGLLVSEMYQMAENVFLNFVDFIEKYGFIPNGGRKYYLNRSQPPVFGLMLEELLVTIEKYGCQQFLKLKSECQDNFPKFIKRYALILESEVKFFKQNRFDGEYNLFKYHTQIGSPRPESYYDDWKVVEKFDGVNESDQISNHA